VSNLTDWIVTCCSWAPARPSSVRTRKPATRSAAASVVTTGAPVPGSAPLPLPGTPLPLPVGVGVGVPLPPPPFGTTAAARLPATGVPAGTSTNASVTRLPPAASATAPATSPDRRRLRDCSSAMSPLLSFAALPLRSFTPLLCAGRPEGFGYASGGRLNTGARFSRNALAPSRASGWWSEIAVRRAMSSIAWASGSSAAA